MKNTTEFTEQFALTWAHAHLVEFLRTHPNANIEEKEKEFLNAFEGGISIALNAFDQR